MRQRLPLLLVGTFGAIMLNQYFVPHAAGRAVYGRVLEWMQVIFAAGLVLGGASYALSHLKKVTARRKDWMYSVFALGALLLMLAGAGFEVAQREIRLVQLALCQLAPD